MEQLIGFCCIHYRTVGLLWEELAEPHWLKYEQFRPMELEWEYEYEHCTSLRIAIGSLDSKCMMPLQLDAGHGRSSMAIGSHNSKCMHDMMHLQLHGILTMAFFGCSIRYSLGRWGHTVTGEIRLIPSRNTKTVYCLRLETRVSQTILPTLVQLLMKHILSYLYPPLSIFLSLTNCSPMALIMLVMHKRQFRQSRPSKRARCCDKDSGTVPDSQLSPSVTVRSVWSLIGSAASWRSDSIGLVRWAVAAASVPML